MEIEVIPKNTANPTAKSAKLTYSQWIDSIESAMLAHQ